MTDSLMGGLLGLLTAVIGAVGGSLFALSRIRKERGFDRRLEWCESMMKALNAAGAAVTSATMGNDPGGREECWTHAIRLYEELIPLCGLKEMYAPEAAIKEIQAFMSEFAKLIESHLASHRADMSAAACDGEVCLRELRRAAGSLAGIGRGHLRLEPLPNTMTDPRERFLGSFRGSDLGQHRAALHSLRDTGY